MARDNHPDREAGDEALDKRTESSKGQGLVGKETGSKQGSNGDTSKGGKT